MRTEVVLIRGRNAYEMILTVRQGEVVLSTLEFFLGRVNPVQSLIALDCSSEALRSIHDRVSNSSSKDWEIASVRIIYRALVVVGSFFSSEEDFHAKLGFFKENSIAMANSMLIAMVNCG